MKELLSRLKDLLSEIIEKSVFSGPYSTMLVLKHKGVSSCERVVIQTVFSFPPICQVVPMANVFHLYFQMSGEYSNDSQIYPSDSEKKFSMI